MKKFLLAAIAAGFAALSGTALAQTVTQVPAYLDNNGGQTYDFGNGPVEILVLGGAAGLFTSSGSGVGSGSTTAITLTATPAIPPCVGCLVSGIGVTSGTTVTAYNGTTGITTNTSQTIAASTALSWGAACPATGAGQKMALVQFGQSVVNGIPFYTQARVCGTSQYNAGATVIPFAIGAH